MSGEADHRVERGPSDKRTIGRPESTVIAGLGPHGEAAASADELYISDDIAERARAARFSVAVVLHTTSSDWANQQLAGILTTLQRYGARVDVVADCRWQSDREIAALRDVIAARPDALISVPLDNAAMADTYRAVAAAGIKVVLMDNAPVGLKAGRDYATIVSSDNLGNGQVAAELLAAHLSPGSAAGAMAFGGSFYATTEREIGFRKWLHQHRPDVSLRRIQFPNIEAAGDVAVAFLEANPDIDGLFVVWDEPAMQVVRALRSRGLHVPITTIDLGNEVALEIAGGDMISGVGTQRPYDHGVAEALATILTLSGVEPPPWIAVPALAVTRATVLADYELVWHMPAPPELREAMRRSDAARPHGEDRQGPPAGGS